MFMINFKNLSIEFKSSRVKSENTVWLIAFTATTSPDPHAGGFRIYICILLFSPEFQTHVTTSWMSPLHTFVSHLLFIPVSDE